MVIPLFWDIDIFIKEHKRLYTYYKGGCAFGFEPGMPDVAAFVPYTHP